MADELEIDSTIVGMPAFVDPNNADAAAGSINVPLNDHPVEHSEDYGQSASPTVVLSAEDPTAAGAIERGIGTAGKTGYVSDDAPEDREEWKKDHWKARAKELGQPVGGSMDEVKARVEDYEGVVAEAGAMSAEEWKGEVADAEDANALADLKALYGHSGADFSTVESAFDDKAKEFGEGSDQ